MRGLARRWRVISNNDKHIDASGYPGSCGLPGQFQEIPSCREHFLLTTSGALYTMSIGKRKDPHGAGARRGGTA